MARTLLFDVVVAVVYFGIFLHIVGRRRSRTDSLALMTATTFLALAFAHATLTRQGVLPPLAVDLLDLERGTAAQHLLLDLGAVVLAVVHMRRERALQSALRYERAIRQTDAFALNDSVVQDLTVAQMALDLGAPDKAEEAIRSAIGTAKRIVGQMLTTPDGAQDRVMSDCGADGSQR